MSISRLALIEVAPSTEASPRRYRLGRLVSCAPVSDSRDLSRKELDCEPWLAAEVHRLLEQAARRPA